MAIFDFIEGWYNPHRIHSALGYRSPIRIRAGLRRVISRILRSSCCSSTGSPRRIEGKTNTLPTFEDDLLVQRVMTAVGYCGSGTHILVEIRS